MKTKLYSYIRFSSMKQADGSSYERQKRTAAEIAAKYDLELVTSYQDFGVSAFKGANSRTGALSRFLDEIGRSVPVGSWLVVENLDRISRQSIIEAQELFLSIIRRGITIVTGMDGKVYSKESVNANPIDLLLSVMLFARANEESQTKRNRTNSSALIKIKAHQENPQNPAVAIEEIGKNMWWTDTTSGYVLPHPVFFPIVQEVVELRRNGRSTAEILDHLNATYTPPPAASHKRHSNWSRAMIERLFHTRALIGIKEISVDGVKYELKDYYPRVLDDAEFYHLKKSIGVRACNYGDKEEVKPIPLLSGVGLLKCEHCGSAMVKVKGTNKRPNQYRYSCDAMRSSRIACVHTNWSFRGDQLEKAVLQLLADKIWIAEDKANPVPALKVQIDEISRKIDNLIALSAMTGATKELADQITTLNSERETLYNQIKMAEEEMYSVDSQGWEKLAEFDLEDVYNEERLKVRFKIKQALKRIGCSRIDRNKNLFVLEYIDGKTQRVVIENSRGTRKGQIFVDLKTINDRQILESNGLVLHPCLDMLTDKNWKPEEEIPGPLQEFGI
ncbi:recombinase family protein [Escherichia coli]|uniref:recombinase family protein n=1 Tax=Escherichia coli TaxID=562 RepID=UPI000BDEA309|nr:recombinase family protein [Escherichia coli]EER1172847.1 recombinase family protein [Escherichia coli]EEU2326992.1 recombinase family protein [Escherichia coli]EEU9832490.1 recombinase family protein [Escherichia coli]EEV1738646.1 recombinase family protein [Escherichia coli]EEV9536387.1 recombinase family protein [Escherichia coli]